MPSRKRIMGLQSSMEYMSTYTWAILIIAIVLVVFYSFGAFNPTTYESKASPGSCSVYRPNGPASTFDIDLAGACENQIPQSVAWFSTQSSYINVPQGNPLSTNDLTVTFWIDLNQTSLPGQYILKDGTNPGWSFYVESDNQIFFCLNGGDCYTNSITPNGWIFVAGTSQSSKSPQQAVLYINGAPVNTFSSVPSSTPSSILMGSLAPGRAQLSGQLSNVQIYNTSLSANDIYQLYLEGIGGDPAVLQKLDAWYPLNGNANDYSGDGLNGVATGVSYINNWEGQYTLP